MGEAVDYRVGQLPLPRQHLRRPDRHVAVVGGRDQADGALNDRVGQLPCPANLALLVSRRPNRVCCWRREDGREFDLVGARRAEYDVAGWRGVDAKAQ